MKLSIVLSNDEIVAAVGEYLCRKLCAAVVVDSCSPNGNELAVMATVAKERGGCRNCGVKGHYEKTCPLPRKSAVAESDEQATE